MKVALTLASLVAVLPSVLAVSEWGQCGGSAYTGSTTCDAGLTCVAVTDSYSQCVSSGGGETSGSETGTSTDATETCTGTTKFKYFGVNQSCAEFGTAIPGTLNKDYTWPSPSSVDFFMEKGMNTFRIAFMMERLVPVEGGLTGPFDATYLQGLKTIVNYVTGKGGYAVIDPHNYARYNGSVITDNSAFGTFWQNLAGEFVSDENVVFDLNNEPYGIPATQAAALMQAGIDGVRAANATQLVLVQGTSWTGAWSWITSGNADAFKSLTDPLDNFAFEMHQYLDTDGSGSNATCISPTVGVERVSISTNWLKENNFKGFIGEMGGGSNDVCVEAVYNTLCHMQQQNGTWLGFAWWAAGPWWGNYFQSIEPPSGPAVSRILPEALLPFV